MRHMWRAVDAQSEVGTGVEEEPQVPAVPAGAVELMESRLSQTGAAWPTSLAEAPTNQDCLILILSLLRRRW